MALHHERVRVKFRGKWNVEVEIPARWLLAAGTVAVGLSDADRAAPPRTGATTVEHVRSWDEASPDEDPQGAPLIERGESPPLPRTAPEASAEGASQSRPEHGRPNPSDPAQPTGVGDATGRARHPPPEMSLEQSTPSVESVRRHPIEPQSSSDLLSSGLLRCGVPTMLRAVRERLPDLLLPRGVPRALMRVGWSRAGALQIRDRVGWAQSAPRETRRRTTSNRALGQYERPRQRAARQRLPSRSWSRRANLDSSR